MRKFLHAFAVALVAVIQSASAQTFTIDPNDTVWVNPPLATLSIFDIYQANQSGSAIDLAWDSVLVDLPEAWDYSTCDLGHCYPGIPAAGGQMIPVDTGALGFLGVNFMPNGVPGTGIVQLRVYDLADPGNAVLLTWIATTDGVGVDEMAVRADLELYPVPAGDVLHVRGITDPVTDVRIVDATGKTVSAGWRQVNDGLSLDVSGLDPGCYVLILNSAAGYHRRSFIKQ